MGGISPSVRREDESIKRHSLLTVTTTKTRGAANGNDSSKEWLSVGLLLT